MSISVELGHASVLFSERAEGDLGRTVGEPDPDVLANRAALLEWCGVRAIRVPSQVHGATVVTSSGGEGYSVGVVTADGLVTTARETAVAVHVADCLPIAIAGAGGVVVVHGGWRGLAGGVIAGGVKALRDLGVEGPLEAAIGPGAGGCCYEVGVEVHAALAGYDANDGDRISLAAVATAQLNAAAVASTDTGICTICAPAGMLFSHRGDGPSTGRQAGVAWLR
jgi:copper oxidase (laccase) domain-containing protein